MTVFKCKMCGGSLEIQPDSSVVACEYCGTMQTLPKLNSDKRVNLYDRANHFRRNDEFDKAISIYEQILNDDDTDAEAYWSLVLCRYGIEYVEDPQTHKQIPTVNRAQFTSVFDDDNYKSALKYADDQQKKIYEQEAKTINEIQKGILSIAQNEEPFDVFICYKETDRNGRRTVDSVLANELYHLLIQEGFKVFFSRITLEDKLGIAYEPYIFAALHSSKVMVVLGTKKEYFNAVWVKNEWSRYLALIKNKEDKVLIPAYRDMDPYDLPEEFSHLQAQDMSKLGFMQDLIRGIKKIVDVDHKENRNTHKTVVIESGPINISALLKRVELFLEDKEWEEADHYCEKILDHEPECAQAYVGKLMASLHVQKQNELANQKEPFEDHDDYQKALRFGDDALKAELVGYIEHIKERNEKQRLEDIYMEAVGLMEYADSEEMFKSALSLFESISDYRDAEQMRTHCIEKRKQWKKDNQYNQARKLQDSSKITDVEKAIKIYEKIIDWKDSRERIAACYQIIQHTEMMSKRWRIGCIVTILTIITVTFGSMSFHFISLSNRYEHAVNLFNNGDYKAAYEELKDLDYSDSKEKAKEARYHIAVEEMDAGKYSEAYDIFSKLNYKDSNEKALGILWLKQKQNLTDINVGDIIMFGAYEQDNNKENGKEEIEWRVLAIEENKALIISEKVLDCQPFNKEHDVNSWEECTLRTWLNNRFYKTSFSNQHRELIELSVVSEYGVNNSKNDSCEDHVFLLNAKETGQYFKTYSDRVAMATKYAYAQGLIGKKDNSVSWWLRSSLTKYYKHYVQDSSGYVDSDYANTDGIGVRPAMWIDLNK